MLGAVFHNLATSWPWLLAIVFAFLLGVEIEKGFATLRRRQWAANKKRARFDKPSFSSVPKENLCLVGRELVQFGNATPIGPRHYRLDRLLRGRRGTEWAMAGHAFGEAFLLIEADRLATVPANAVHIGETSIMLAIGIGDPTPAEAATMVSGEALQPLSPVHLRQAPDGAGGRAVRWTRRSRAGWRWTDGVDAPLGEERERYAVRLLAAGVAIRAAETDGAAWTYDAAMAADDVAAGHTAPLVVEVRQIGTYATGRAAALTLID